MSELLKRIEEYSLEEIMGERFGRYCKTNYVKPCLT